MYFSGDAGTRRKVEIRGRSSKESDRQALLNKVKHDRELRMRNRQKVEAALCIQKYFRGRREIAAQKDVFRREFYQHFGENSELAGRDAFKPQSLYLTAFFYFFSNPKDVPRLFGVCRLFRRLLAENGGDVTAMFTNNDYDVNRAIVNHRVKRLASHCLHALWYCRFEMKNELLSNMSKENSGVAWLVETIVHLVREDCPWTGVVLEHLVRINMFSLLRDMLLIVDVGSSDGTMSSLEHLVYKLSLQYMKKAVLLNHLPFSSSFTAQIFSIPFLWKRLPVLKQIFAAEGLWEFSIRQAAAFFPQIMAALPTHGGFPSSVCLLGNILEASVLALARNDHVIMVAEFAKVCSYMINSLPSAYLHFPEPEDDEEDEDMLTEEKESLIPKPDLVAQLQYAADPDVMNNVVRIAFSSTTFGIDRSYAIGAVCGFLLATFSVAQTNTVLMSHLNYTAPIVAPLWQYIKVCHQNSTWPAVEFPGVGSPLTPEVLGWMLPLAVFCRVYNYSLVTTDNEEFYERHTNEAEQLVSVFKEALWQVLWVMPPTTTKSSPALEVFSYQNMRQTFVYHGARLLTELHDRNSKRQFLPFHAFHARDAVEESFFQQAEAKYTKASDLLKRAPFLVPFTSRVRIYTSQLAAARQNSDHHGYNRVRIRVQRDRIIEDSFAQLNQLSEDDLKETIRVSYVNELGLEEAGVDGGGLFKDFMENVTKAAFDIQYGLFKETTDHLLYPNPASHLVHNGHLQYFEFLGKMLGKAMFEGILVDIPFATFFLSKLKKKYNHLHDLPSLDPVLYKNLLFLKNNPELPQLGLYFAIGDDEYGQQRETPLLPGGNDLQVTEDNVFRYIHLMANHRLNEQIRLQSSSFLRGFQQLIKAEWIDMFNEHELQILISGSRDVMDVDDLRMNVNYAGGYYEDHPVIEMFWETVKTLDVDLQRNFLKFVTGCSRGPLLGFRYLEPQFCIQKTAPDDAGDEVLDRLPTAATCMNLLKLPPYRSKAILRDKLLYAITSGSGFDLS